MPIVEINYWAVLVAALVSMVLGALWYSPLLFGKLWMDLISLDQAVMKSMKKKANVSYALNFVAALVLAYVLAHFVDYTEATTMMGGLQIGFLVWLGFVATVTLGSVLWEGKSWKVWVLNNAYQLLALLFNGAILAVWA